VYWVSLVPLKYIPSLLKICTLFFFFLVGTDVCTQDILLARQATSPVWFALVILEMGSTLT
jgi:hypothetical protein